MAGKKKGALRSRLLFEDQLTPPHVDFPERTAFSAAPFTAMYLGRFNDVRPQEYCFRDCVLTVRRPWRALQSERCQGAAHGIRESELGEE